MSPLRGRALWMLAYLFLAAADFLYFLYSHRLSHAIGAFVFILIAVGWDWWFRRLAKENEVTKLNLNMVALMPSNDGTKASTGRSTSSARAN